MARPLNEFGVTEQQEKFCRVFVETGNASEAYRQAYNAKNMTQNSIAVKASELLSKVNVTVRVGQMRETHQKRHNVTVDSIVAELEEARQMALNAATPQTSAAVAASMGKAKLYGLEKSLLEISGELNVRKTLDDFYGDA